MRGTGTDGRWALRLAAIGGAWWLATGCGSAETREAQAGEAPIVIDVVGGERTWAMSGLKKKLGDPAHGGTGPVDAEKESVLASLKRRTSELYRTTKRLETTRRELDAARAKLIAQRKETARLEKANAALAARVEALEKDRRALTGRALEAELQRILAEQRLVQVRLEHLEEVP